MSPTPRAEWRLILLSYACPTCGAQPGEDCVTSGGKPVRDGVHAPRVRDVHRCPRCGSRMREDEDEGALCPRCALVRALEVERATKYRRDT